MARQRRPIELVKMAGRKHLTKKEIEERKKEELTFESKKIIAPVYLNDEDKKEFKKIAKRLLEIKIMTDLDSETLAAYVQNKRKYLNISQKIDELINNDVDDIDELTKLINIQDKLYKQCRAGSQDLGLTISSRCKLIVPQKKEENEENKFQQFLKKAADE